MPTYRDSIRNFTIDYLIFALVEKILSDVMSGNTDVYVEHRFLSGQCPICPMFIYSLACSFYLIFYILYIYLYPVTNVYLQPCLFLLPYILHDLYLSLSRNYSNYIPTNIYLPKVNNGNTRKRCEICLS